jgi:hypothetical protein
MKVGQTKHNSFMLPSLLTSDPSSSIAQGLVPHRRTLDVVRAVTMNEATKLKEEGEREREKTDKRNGQAYRKASQTMKPLSFLVKRRCARGRPGLYCWSPLYLMPFGAIIREGISEKMKLCNQCKAASTSDRSSVPPKINSGCTTDPIPHRLSYDALPGSPSHHILDTISRMAKYFDYQGVNSGLLEAGPSGFIRPLTLADRKSGGDASYNSRASSASDLTYATDASTPVREEPLGLQREEKYDDDDSEEGSEDDEYMMVDADLSMAEAQNQQGDRKGFAGGFVSGLRRLRRLLLNQRGQTVQRQPSHDTVLELPGFGENSGYDPFRAQPPSILRPATIPQPTFAPHHPQNTPHASILTKSTVTPGTTPFLSTITPSTTYSSLRHRRRNRSRPHPAIESPQPLNLYKPATSGSTPSRSGVKRSYSATRPRVLSPLQDVQNLEPFSSATLYPRTPSEAYLQPLSRSASSPTRSLKKVPSHPAMKSDNTWSKTAGKYIRIFISCRNLTSRHPRCFVSHTTPRYVPPIIWPAHASSLCLFTSSSCVHPVRREPNPISPDRFGLYYAFSSPGTHHFPACYGSTHGGPGSTRSQISQIPMDDRRQSQLAFQEG